MCWFWHCIIICLGRIDGYLHQEEKAGTARKLLGLPMSRRERLQLTNKEKARNERRARARKRRIDLEDVDGSSTNAKPKGNTSFMTLVDVLCLAALWIHKNAPTYKTRERPADTLS